MIAEIPLNEYHAALDRCVTDILWEASIDAPPVNCFRLAEHLGIRIAEDTKLTGRGRFVRLRGGRDTIFLREEERPERRHWSVGHEIGEAVSHRVFSILGIDPTETPPATREEIANQLASRLLLPHRWFRSLCQEFDNDLAELKQVFSTASYELIARRLLDCSREPIVVSLYDQNAITWRRASHGSVGAPHPVEWECQQQAHRHNEPTWVGANALFDTGFARIRCWPIHENGWQREIVISEPHFW